MTTNQVDLIEPANFIQQLLEESTPAYIWHVIMIKDYPSQVQFSQIAQISAGITDTVTLPEVYKDFEDVFFTQNVGHLPFYQDHEHDIDLIDGK